ncbi:ABC transporter ATP-binding protein [Leuconostoc palmae]|uniref:ABC transporter ATP-binding protein n=1 Tax=Leuconostoc palmae TaxID=501487 RepID=UPI001C7D0FD5|nr:ABC transporter ATP-binding protein [Leuconostoc palmae]
MGLNVNNLTGGYSGTTVLNGVNFKVENGEIVALIGLNGAGKSTTINHIIGELQPTSGEISLNGARLADNPTIFKKQIAYIPEQPMLYDELTLSEHLHLMLATHEIDNVQSWKRVEELLNMFRLSDKQHWLPTHFSKGMKQKVMLVAAFMLESPLLIVDEPFLGLDTVAQKDVIQLLKQHASLGNSVLMTTHLLSSAAKFVDRFVVLKDGQVYFTGSAAQLGDRFNLKFNQLDDFFDVFQQVSSYEHA